MVIEYKRRRGDPQIAQALGYAEALRLPEGAQKFALLAQLRGFKKINDSIVRIILVAPWEGPDLQKFARKGVHLEWNHHTCFENGCLVFRRTGEGLGEASEPTSRTGAPSPADADCFWTALIPELIRELRFDRLRLFAGDYFCCPVFPDRHWCLSYMLFVVKAKAEACLDFRNTAADKASYRWGERKRRFDFLTSRPDFHSIKEKLGGGSCVSPRPKGAGVV